MLSNFKKREGKNSDFGRPRKLSYRQITERKNMIELKSNKLISRQELQERLGKCSRTSIYRWEKDGLIPHSIKIGSNNYWRESEIDTYINSLTN